MSRASRVTPIVFAFATVLPAGCKGPSTSPTGSISVSPGKGDSATSASLELVAGQLGAKGSADGVGAEARFQSPGSLTRDGASLFAIDAEKRRIRRINLQTAGVTTFAAKDPIVHPSELSADGAGALFVIDDAALRRVTIKTEAIETVSQIPGTCAGRDGLFLAASPSAVYVSDRCSSVVRRFDPASGSWSVLAGAESQSGSVDGGATSARFARLQGLALDPSGVLFVVDGARLRRINPQSGAVTTVGGSTASDGGAVMRLAFADAQTPVVTDVAANTVSRFDLATGQMMPLAGAPGPGGNADGDAMQALFAHPAGVAGDGAGKVYVADTSNNTIRAIVLQSGAVSTLAGRGQQSGSTDGNKTDARFHAPEAVTTSRDGDLFVSDSANHTIRRIAASTGAVTTVAGQRGIAGSKDGGAEEASFNHPGGIVALDDQLYVADTNNQAIRQISIKTGAVTTLAGVIGMPGTTDGPAAQAQFRRPKGLAVEGGRLYVADTENNVIREIDLSTKMVSTLAGAPSVGGSAEGDRGEARFFWPFGLRGDGKGNLYVADTYNRLIRKVEIATGRVTTLAGTAGAQAPWSVDGVGADARFNYPVDVVPDSAGHLFIADQGNNTIRMLSLESNRVVTVVGSAGQAGAKVGTGGGVNWPASLTAGGDGSLVILDQRENALLRLR